MNKKKGRIVVDFRLCCLVRGGAEMNMGCLQVLPGNGKRKKIRSQAFSDSQAWQVTRVRFSILAVFPQSWLCEKINPFPEEKLAQNMGNLRQTQRPACREAK